MQASMNSNTAVTLLKRVTSPCESKRTQTIAMAVVCHTNSSTFSGSVSMRTVVHYMNEISIYI